MIMEKVKFYLFKVTLREVANPTVWREIAVPAGYTFDKFHRTLQLAFGWSDYHLYEFTDKIKAYEPGLFRITIPSEYDGEYEEKTYDSRRKKLSSIFPKRKALSYFYDFGDGWNFEILYLKSFTSDRCPHAGCMDGGGATPPEDCGGPHGYEEMKVSFAKQDDEVESYREWLGLKSRENWEADFFPLQILRYINIGLAYLGEDADR